uniref:(northern house mosquito) hypothetical protein n=1 Tax=Culex pipiens TaxID=7175 RepID=A0A8D8CBT8_CULPI
MWPPSTSSTWSGTAESASSPGRTSGRSGPFRRSTPELPRSRTASPSRWATPTRRCCTVRGRPGTTPTTVTASWCSRRPSGPWSGWTFAIISTWNRRTSVNTTI